MLSGLVSGLFRGALFQIHVPTARLQPDRRCSKIQLGVHRHT
jgi:hypothetical protein